MPSACAFPECGGISLEVRRVSATPRMTWLGHAGSDEVTPWMAPLMDLDDAC